MLTTRLLPVEHLALDNATPETKAAAGDAVPELTLMRDGDLAWGQRQLPLEAMLRALSQPGITEVNLKAAPLASLAAFTNSVSALKMAGINAHWERSAASLYRQEP